MPPTVQQPECIVVAKILKLQQHVWLPRLQGLHHLCHEAIKLSTSDAGGLNATIVRVFKIPENIGRRWALARQCRRWLHGAAVTTVDVDGPTQFQLAGDIAIAKV